MRVQRVAGVAGATAGWTVIGGDRRPVGPVERYLAWLSDVERSPNTVRAYAQDLKTFWVFLGVRGIAWDGVTLEQLGQFTAWLRQPAGNVIVPRWRAGGAVLGDGQPDADGGVRVLRVPCPQWRRGREGAG